MATKTITITDDAYGEIRALRLPDESFSDAIKRLTRTKGGVKDCVGLWRELDREERETIRRAIAAGRQTAPKLLRKMHGHLA
jgi:predicted CopG family antitoxin